MVNRVDYATAGSLALAINHEKRTTTRMISWVDAASVKIPASQYITITNSVMIVEDDITLTWADIDAGVEEIGKDYFVYACLPLAGSTPIGKISLASTFPAGYDATNSRKIGGFHNNPDGNILQYSVWDLDFKPVCSNPVGMVYCAGSNSWIDIYLAADDGASGVKSQYAATILDTIDWMNFVDRGGLVGKRLLRDFEFQLAAAGSPEEVNIGAGAACRIVHAHLTGADPITTGGHAATSAAAMKSTIGCEDLTGAMDQWLLDQSWKPDGTAVQFGWYDVAGGKGSLYITNNIGDVKLFAGGAWDGATGAGSRSRNAGNARWAASAAIGARFAAEHYSRS